MVNKSIMPLVLVEEGKEAIVVEVKGGYGFVRRLAELGIVPGVKIKIENNSWGPIVVSISGFKIALGRGMARKILVRMA